MNTEQILKANELLGGKLADRRDEIKVGLLKLVLSECTKDEVTIEDINRICRAMHDLELDDGTIANKFQEWEGLYVERTNDGKYKIINKPRFDDIEDQIGDLWDEFEPILHLYKQDDVDPYYVSQVKPVFIDFFKRFITELTKSVEILDEYQIESIYKEYDGIEELINETAEHHRLQEKGIFRKSIREYLTNPGEELLEFTNDCYTTAINVDLLDKEDKLIDFPDLSERNRQLYLDTNILVALLADTHIHHPLTHIVCKKSNDMGFNLRYTKDTKQEMVRLLNGTKDEMSGVHSDSGQIPIVDSPFVADFQNKPESSWEEYISEIEGWEDILNKKYNISELDTNKEPHDVIFNEAKRIMTGQYTYDLNERKLRRIDHDANLLGLVAKEREFLDISFGPFVLSLDNDLTQLGRNFASEHETRDIVSGRTLTFQPRSWLNYIMAFFSVDIQSNDKKQIAKSVLRIASQFDDDITVDEYIHTFAPKIDVDKSDENSLKELLLNHPNLSGELEEAIEENKGHKAEKISREIITDKDYIDTIEESREFDERIKKASSTINNLRNEIEELREENNETSIEEVRKLYAERKDEFISKFPGEISESDFDDPPNEDAELAQIKNWLEMTIAIVTVSSDLPDQIKELKPDLEEVLADIITIEN